MTYTNLTEVPTPKYKIGDVVFLGETERRQAQLPCPDCLGSRKWTVTTPGGGAYETKCQRCDGHYNRFQNLPSLFYEEHAPKALQLTIGSIRIDTNVYEDAGPIQYMCRETGVGSGSCYYEGKALFRATYEEALEDARVKAAILNDRARETPELIQQRFLADFTVEPALVKAADHLVWSAWYAYRHLVEDLQESTKEGQPEVGLLEHVREDILKWEFGRHGDMPELSKLLALVAAVRDGCKRIDPPLVEIPPRLVGLFLSISALCKWFDELPDDLRPFVSRNKTEEII